MTKVSENVAGAADVGANQTTLWPDNAPTDPDVVAKSYDEHASTYGESVIKDGWHSSFTLINPELQKLLSESKKDEENSEHKTVLDTGCGDGLLPDEYDFSKYNVTLYGIDISPEMLAIAKKKNVYNHLEVVNIAENLPFTDGLFDILVANGVLGYLATAKPVYEFVRIVKPRGHIMFTMRQSHFNERGFGKAVEELKDSCTVLTKRVFTAFPNNPEYKHDYLFVHIRKN